MWFWHPLLVSSPAEAAGRPNRVRGAFNPRGDGGKRNSSPGRARRSLLKPSRREGRMIRPHLWFCRVYSFMHADRGCVLAPGLPCALVIDEGLVHASSGRIQRRGNGDACLSVLKIEDGPNIVS